MQLCEIRVRVFAFSFHWETKITLSATRTRFSSWDWTFLLVFQVVVVNRMLRTTDWQRCATTCMYPCCCWFLCFYLRYIPISLIIERTGKRHGFRRDLIQQHVLRINIYIRSLWDILDTLAGPSDFLLPDLWSLSLRAWTEKTVWTDHSVTLALVFYLWVWVIEFTGRNSVHWAGTDTVQLAWRPPQCRRAACVCWQGNACHKIN